MAILEKTRMDHSNISPPGKSPRTSVAECPHDRLWKKFAASAEPEQGSWVYEQLSLFIPTVITQASVSFVAQGNEDTGGDGFARRQQFVASLKILERRALCRNG